MADGELRGVINMTVSELRSLFRNGTEFWCEPYPNATTGFKITNRYFGIDAFANMKIPLYGIRIGNNNIVICFNDMPKSIFEAWMHLKDD